MSNATENAIEAMRRLYPRALDAHFDHEVCVLKHIEAKEEWNRVVNRQTTMREILLDRLRIVYCDGD